MFNFGFERMFGFKKLGKVIRDIRDMINTTDNRIKDINYKIDNLDTHMRCLESAFIKEEYYPKSIINNIHTLQVRLHNLDLKMNMILDNMPKAIEAKPKRMKKVR